ncbi:MAG: histidine--tRNA ligase [Thermomicrobiales bacterium]
MSVRKPQILKGFRDYMPEQKYLRDAVAATFREVFARHGFQPLDTPALEYMEILTGKAGENEKLMYHFADQGEREIGLRYDLTVPLARVVAMHQNEIVMPFKRYHMAPVWRAEKPQRGRFREFWQCDADIVGTTSMLADAEGISVLVDALHAIGMTSAVVHINHRKLLKAMAMLAGVEEENAATVYRAIDKLAKIGPDGVQAELERAGIPAGSARQVIDLVSTQGTSAELLDLADAKLAAIPGGPEAVAELRELMTFIGSLGVPHSAYTIDLSLARGIDYYTGPVYEAIVDEPKVGSVAGGGRYDGLVGMFLGRDVPATGISLGMERILEVLREFDLFPVPPTTTDVFVVSLPDTLAYAAHIARELRKHGINADQSIQPNRSIGDQLKYADRLHIPLAVIPGSAELAEGKVSVKDLASGEQRTVDIAVLWEDIVRSLGR